MENSQKSQHKGVIALGVTVVVLVLMILGLFMAYYFQANHVIDLDQRVTDLKASAAEKDKALAENAVGATKLAIQTQYREIPELGVKYKVTDQTKNLTYQYYADEQGRFEGVRFTTKELARLKDSQSQNPCAASMPSGSISRQMTAPSTNDPRIVTKKIGGYYFMYNAPEVGCMIDTHDAPGFQQSVQMVKAAYDSLEAM
jgi:hypothetical protein